VKELFAEKCAFILYKADLNLPVVDYDPYHKIVLRIQEIKLNFIS